MRQSERNRPRAKRFRGSTAEWLAVYAALFLFIAIVGLTEVRDAATLALIGAALIVAGSAIYAWKR